MSEHIVVSCRMNGEEVGRPEARYLERARALAQQAEALGATLAAWSATTMAFAWDTESLEEAIQFACDANADGEKLWACALARGALVPLSDRDGQGLGGGRADLAWGEPLVAAVILARAARAGEVLIEESFAGLDAFVATGKRIARDGERRVRGVRIDRLQPWKRDVAAAVERLVTGPLVGSLDVQSLLARPGLVHVVRANPGHGGTRILFEIARAVAPSASLVVSPAGASVEPLGALRRALGRTLGTRPPPEDAETAALLRLFLSGVGASIEQGAALIASYLRPSAAAEPPGALFLDDAGDIDAESLEACAHLVASMPTPVHVFVRIDATDQLPAAFASLPLGKEIELGLLERSDAEALACGVTKGALGARSARRIARQAGYAPLAIEEEIAFGLTSGDIAWAGDKASLRTASSLAGKPAGASAWIAKRAKATASAERGVLATIALFGGEASLDNVRAALALIEPGIAVEDEARKLEKKHWLIASRAAGVDRAALRPDSWSKDAWVALPSRTHKDTIADLLDEAPRRVLHTAIADVLEESEGELGCAEAAHHAVNGGDGERGARLALRAARAAHVAGMAKSASRLLTLARLANPKCEPLARQQLLTSIPPPMPALAGGGGAKSDKNGDKPSAKGTRKSDRPRSPGAPAPPAKSATDELPTQRRKLDSNPATVPPPAAKPNAPESDYPTMLNAPALPGRIRTPKPPASAPARADGESAVRPPPRPPPSRGSVRGMPAVSGLTSTTTLPSLPPLPKPSAPLPLRPSAPSMPPPVPRADGASRGAPAVRQTLQMPAVRSPPSRAPAPMPPAASVDRAVLRADSPSSSVPEPSASEHAGAQSALVRMLDLAKSALVGGDVAGVDRWTEGLRASGEHDLLAGRLEAIARITRGQVGEGLRSLRALRERAPGASGATRVQTSLALGVGLAAANRPDEALLEALDALARAREGGDRRAVGACLAFLAKLYERVERSEDAAALSAAAGKR